MWSIGNIHHIEERLFRGFTYGRGKLPIYSMAPYSIFIQEIIKSDELNHSSL